VTLDRRTVVQTGLATSSTRGRTAARSYHLQVLGHGGATIALGARPLVVGASVAPTSSQAASSEREEDDDG